MDRTRSVKINKRETAPHAREELRRQKTEKKRLRRRRLSSFYLVIFLILLGVGIYALQRPEFRIQSVSIVGSKVVNRAQAKIAVKKVLSGRYFFIVPRDSIFFYSRKSIKSNVSKISGYVASTSLDLNKSRVLEVNIHERNAKYIWCNKQVVDRVTSDCYFVDKNGLFFSRSSGLSRNILFLIESSLPDKVLGKYVLAVEDFTVLIKTIDYLPQIISFAGMNNIEIEKVIIDDKGDYLFQVEERKEGEVEFWEIRWDPRDNVSTLASRLKVLWQDKTFTYERNKSELDYIDLRFGKKVFYRPKGETSSLD
ncbi:MAG: hypothetical protein AAB821_03055 [Patescibacteria group bacterium]